jgi:hypothetical protein
MESAAIRQVAEIPDAQAAIGTFERILYRRFALSVGFRNAAAFAPVFFIPRLHDVFPPSSGDYLNRLDDAVFSITPVILGDLLKIRDSSPIFERHAKPPRRVPMISTFPFLVASRNALASVKSPRAA